MTDPTSNDNDFARANSETGGPDAHGQAAILLVESLIHSLIMRSVISVENAIEIVSVAAEVKDEIAFEMGDSAPTLAKSLAILAAIRSSLDKYLPGGDVIPWPPAP